MRRDIATTRAAIGAVTQMLAGKKIKVTQRGDRAFVLADSRTGIPTLLNIPYLPDNASEELVAAVQGYLDHEVGHLFETDFTVHADRATPDFKRIDTVHNIVEDCWLEPRMAKRFKGSGFNLANVRTMVFKVKGMESLTTLRAAGLDGDEKAAVSAFLVTLLRALSGHQECVDFMDENDVWSMFPTILPRLKTFFPDEIHACKNSAETLQLALKVYDVIKGEDFEGEKGEGSDEESFEKTGKFPKEEGDKKSEDKEPDEDDEKKGKSSDEVEASDEGDAETEDAETEDAETEDAETEDAETEEIGSEGAETEEIGSEGDTCEDMTGALDGVEDFAEAVSEAARTLYLNTILSEDAPEWLIYTSDFDRIEPYKISGKFQQAWVQEMQDNVRQHVGPMQKEIERLILSKRRTLYQPGMRRGRINPSSLHRLKVGDDRVFRIKHEKRDKNTAVKLLVDLSGSMGAGPGSKLDLAMQSAFALAQTLERCRIAVDVTGFTTKDMPSNVRKELHESERRIGRRYSVSREGTYMPIFKGWSERLTSDVMGRFADMRYDPQRIRDQNIDNVAVDYALRDLAQRSEERKILIVLSDGAPCFTSSLGSAASARELPRVIARGEKSGIETVGIGIMSEAVRQYYPKYAVIRSVGQLPSSLMLQLREVLLK